MKKLINRTLSLSFAMVMVFVSFVYANETYDFFVDETNYPNEVMIQPYEEATYALNGYIADNQTITITRYAGVASDDLVIPDDYNGFPITTILQSAFLDESDYYPERGSFTGNIKLGKNIKIIGEAAFQNCKCSGKLVIPDNVREIGSNAFMLCRNLTEIELGKGVEKIGGGAFVGCSFQGTITFPSTLTEIDTSYYEDVDGNPVKNTNAMSFDIARFSKVINNSNVEIRLPVNAIPEPGSSPEEEYYWKDQETGEIIASITNGVAIRSGSEDEIEDEEEEEEPINSVFEHWGFANSADNFGEPKNGYCISRSDYKRLLSDLPNTARADIENKYNVDGKKPVGDEWGGSCYGMSVSAMRIADRSDIIDDYDLGKEVTILNDVEEADKQFKMHQEDSVGIAESVINFYHYQQLLPEYQVVRAEFAGFTSDRQMMKVAEMAKETQVDHYPMVVDLFWWDSSEKEGHSVNAIGYRELSPDEEYYSDYPHCILTFDCSNPEETGDNSPFNIYFNDNGEWSVPGWGISPQNADGICATKDPNVAGAIDYRTATYQGSTSMPDSISYHGGDAEWQLQWDEEDGIVIDGAEVIGPILDERTVNILPEMTDQNEPNYRAYVPEAEEYWIEAEKLDHTLRTDDAQVRVETENEGTAWMNREGESYVAMETADIIVIETILNEAEEGTPTNISVFVPDSEELAVTPTNQGWLVESDDLSAVEIAIGNIIESISTDQKSVLITENSKGSVEAFEDRDGDGVYDDSLTGGLITRFFRELANIIWRFIGVILRLFD